MGIRQTIREFFFPTKRTEPIGVAPEVKRIIVRTKATLNEGKVAVKSTPKVSKPAPVAKATAKAVSKPTAKKTTTPATKPAVTKKAPAQVTKKPAPKPATKAVKAVAKTKAKTTTKLPTKKAK
jgi:hypothetical protein